MQCDTQKHIPLRLRSSEEILGQCTLMFMYSSYGSYPSTSLYTRIMGKERRTSSSFLLRYVYVIVMGENSKSEIKGEHPYPFQNLIRFTTFSQYPEHFVLVIFGTKRGNLLKRGTFSSLYSVQVSMNGRICFDNPTELAQLTEWVWMTMWQDDWPWLGPIVVSHLWYSGLPWINKSIVWPRSLKDAKSRLHQMASQCSCGYRVSSCHHIIPDPSNLKLSGLTLWGLQTLNVTSPRDWALFGNFIFFLIKPVFYLSW